MTERFGFVPGVSAIVRLIKTIGRKLGQITDSIGRHPPTQW